MTAQSSRIQQSLMPARGSSKCITATSQLSPDWKMSHFLFAQPRVAPVIRTSATFVRRLCASRIVSKLFSRLPTNFLLSDLQSSSPVIDWTGVIALRAKSAYQSYHLDVRHGKTQIIHQEATLHSVPRRRSNPRCCLGLLRMHKEMVDERPWKRVRRLQSFVRCGVL